MSKTIFLCASMAFYPELVEIEQRLIDKGFIVNIPISAQTMKKNNDFEVSHFKDVFSYEQKSEFIRHNLQTLSKGDCILVINGEKNGIKGYIGANVLMEIALAFFFSEQIYIWNPIEENVSYKEELLSFGAKFINQDLDQIGV